MAIIIESTTRGARPRVRRRRRSVLRCSDVSRFPRMLLLHTKVDVAQFPPGRLEHVACDDVARARVR